MSMNDLNVTRFQLTPRTRASKDDVGCAIFLGHTTGSKCADPKGYFLSSHLITNTVNGDEKTCVQRVGVEYSDAKGNTTMTLGVGRISRVHGGRVEVCLIDPSNREEIREALHELLAEDYIDYFANSEED